MIEPEKKIDKNYTYCLYTDGSYRRELQAAGFGGYIIDKQDNLIFEFSEIISDPLLYTKHEWVALEYGLQKCLDLGIYSVHCYHDEQNIGKILQIEESSLQQSYCEKNPVLNNLYHLVSQFHHIDFFFIPRDENKMADKLSHRALDLFTKNKTRMAEGRLYSDKFYCIEQYVKNEKILFNDLKSQVSHYFTFELLNHQQQYQELKIHEVFKLDNNELSILELPSITLPISGWVPQFIYAIYDTLSPINDLKIGLTFVSNVPNTVEKIIRGLLPIPPKCKNAAHQLISLFENFDLVIAHNEQSIKEAVCKKLANPSPLIRSDNKKEVYLQAIKKIGEETYQLGQNKLVDHLYYQITHIDKFSDPFEEVQKKLFGELLNIILKENKNNSVSLSHQNIQEYISSVKKDIEQKGIKLRF